MLNFCFLHGPKTCPRETGSMSSVFLEVFAVSPETEAPGMFLSVSAASQFLLGQNNPYTTLEAGTESGTPLVLLKSWPLLASCELLHYGKTLGVSLSRTCGLVIRGKGSSSCRSWGR